MIAYVIYDTNNKRLELSCDFERNCLRMEMQNGALDAYTGPTWANIPLFIRKEELKQLASFINQIANNLDEQKKPSCTGTCGMNYCDENGCVERKRNLVDGCTDEFAEPHMEPFPESRISAPVPPAIKGGSHA